MFDSLDTWGARCRAQRARGWIRSRGILPISIRRAWCEGGEDAVSSADGGFAAPGQGGDPSQPGVHVQDIQTDQSPFIRKYDPGHPDAGTDGYVKYPNIDLSIEYINALDASRAYEANISMMETTKAMINSSLRLLA